jgi:hypothetical protein
MAFALLTSSLTLLSGQPTGAQAAGVLAAGTAVRIDSTGKLAATNAEVLGESDCHGILLSEANAANQWVQYAKPGCKLTVSGLTGGETYYCGGSGDAGEVGVRADAVTGTHFATIAGIAHSATVFEVVGIKTGFQL